MKPLARASGLLAAAAALLAGAAAADDIAGVIAARHDHFKSMGAAAKALTGELDAPALVVADVRRDAATLDALAAELPTWFPAGSGPDSGAKTRALPAIWTTPEAFAKDAKDLALAADRLNAAAADGRMDTLRPALAAVKATCKTCHDAFRGPET